MISFLSLSLVLTLFGASQDIPALESRKAVERQIANREVHTYRLYAGEGEYFRLELQPNGIALVTSLSSPSGKPIAEVVNRTGEVRSRMISAASDEAGYYRLQIALNGPTEGKYQITVAELRPVQPIDQTRIDAERAFNEGRRLRGAGTKASLDRAIELFQTALPKWRMLSEASSEALTLMEIGSIYFLMGDTNQYTQYETQALTIWRALEDRSGEGETLNNLGLAHWARGERDDALDKLQQALLLRHGAGDTRGEAETMRNLGTVYAEMGDLQPAIRIKQEALEKWRMLGDLDQEAGTLNDFAVIYGRLGQSERALDYYSKALALNRQLSNVRAEGLNLLNMGVEYEKLGDARKALDYLVPALKLIRQVGNRPGESVALQYTGRAYFLQGDYGQALQYYEQALEMQRSLQAARSEAFTDNLIAEAYLETGKPAEALTRLDDALALARKIGDRMLESDTLADRARAFRNLGDVSRALSEIEESIQFTESLRAAVASGDLRTSYLSTASGRYDLQIELLMSLNRDRRGGDFVTRALEVSERARARGLLDLLTEARTTIREGVDPALLKREQSLLLALDDKTQRQIRLLAGAHTAVQASNIEKELRTLTLQYEEVESEVRERSPRYAALTQPQPLKLPEIQRLLDDGTLLLEYALGEKRSFLWVVGASSIDVFELPKRLEVETAARNAYDEMSVNNPAGRQGVAVEALSEIVIKPAASLLGNKRLAIVTSGALQYIPFAVLRVPGESGALVENHEIVHIPSASTLSELRREMTGRKAAPKKVAVFADPVFDRADPRVGRTERPVTPTPASENLERSARETGLTGFVRLRASRQEAEAIVNLAGSNNSLLALDFAASRKTAVSPGLADYRIVHFATHGLLNTQHPELSGLVLSLVDREGKPQNGFLESAEIYNLKLGADLVVLSACQTALGKEVRGEGLVGLTRGFMYAGAPRVLASLWPVPDQATTELMKRFYQAVLKNGMRPSAALQSAQIGMRGDRRWQAPYYWAGFVLQGEWK